MKYTHLNLLIIPWLFWLQNTVVAASVDCSEDWYVTGYYTPIENNFYSATVKYVHVDRLGWRSFPPQFIADVRIEGWGKTKDGWYLGYYNKKWHKSKHPLDSQGSPLVVGMVATDKNVIAHGQRVNIPALQEYMVHSYFIATDVGSAIKQRHIDVYTGEGVIAKQLALDLTSENHTVCLIHDVTAAK